MSVTIGPYLAKKVGNSIGQVASFKVGNKATGVVLQYVKHTTHLGNQRSTEKFTEAWPVRKGKISPEGKDYFLVPIDWRDVDGKIAIDAVLWFVEGSPTTILAACDIKRGVVDIAGTLPARYGKVPDEYREGAGSIRRKWSATWTEVKYKKDFKPKYKHQTQTAE